MAGLYCVSVIFFLCCLILDAECSACNGGLFTGQKFGHVSSPNYPQNYPDLQGEACVYDIEVVKDALINLTFSNFDVQQTDEHGVCSDYIAIHDGVYPTWNHLGTFCNNRPPPALIQSTGNHISIAFVSDDEENNQGFHIEYIEHCPFKKCPIPDDPITEIVGPIMTSVGGILTTLGVIVFMVNVGLKFAQPLIERFNIQWMLSLIKHASFVTRINAYIFMFAGIQTVAAGVFDVVIHIDSLNFATTLSLIMSGVVSLITASIMKGSSGNVSKVAPAPAAPAVLEDVKTTTGSPPVAFSPQSSTEQAAEESTTVDVASTEEPRSEEAEENNTTLQSEQQGQVVDTSAAQPELEQPEAAGTESPLPNVPDVISY